MSATLNPYATPKALVEDVGSHPEAEAVRRANLSHEASVRSIGTLYYLGALGATLGVLSTVVQLLLQPRHTGVLLMFGAMTVLSIVFFLLGRGLRKLRPGVRVPTIALAGLGLLGFPLGTLINGYILWLMLSQKGRFIFSPEYAAVVEATPHIKYRTSILVWIFLGLVVVGLLAAIVIPALSR